MKSKTIITIIFIMFLVNGCIVKSLHPFFNDEDVVFYESLLGEYMDQDSTTWYIEQYEYSNSFMGNTKKDSSYLITFFGEEKDTLTKSVFRVHLFLLNGELYFDFFPVMGETIGETFADWHLIPTHSLAKVKIWGENHLSFQWFEEDWMNDLFKENRVKISHEKIETRMMSESYILTASTRELQKFIIKFDDEVDNLQYMDESRILEEKDYFGKFRIMNAELDSISKIKERRLIELGPGDAMILNLMKVNSE